MSDAKVVKKKCCDTFDHALESRTDNEGWGALIYQRGHKFSTGSSGELEAISYCPWCGAGIITYETVKQ